MAKYFWDRRYSCPHTSVPYPHTPELFPQHASLNVRSLGRDIDRLLKELQGIANDLELLRKTPFRAEDVSRTPETITEEDVRTCKETEPLKAIPNAYQRCHHNATEYAERPFI